MTMQPISRRRFLQAGATVSGLALSSNFLNSLGAGAITRIPEASSSKDFIGVILDSIDNYSLYTATGVYQAISQAGLNYGVKVVNSNLDPSTEKTNFENFIAQGAKGIIVIPVEIASAGSGAQLAQAKQIPVGVAVWPGPSAADKHFTRVVSINSTTGGKLIGDYLVKKLPKGGPIVVVQGVVGAGFSEVIDAGLDKTIAGTKLKVVVRQQGFFERTKAVSIVQSAYQAHPDLVAIVNYSASMGDGIAQWLQTKNLTHIVHVTSDGDLEMLKWLKTPYLTADRFYSAAQTGNLATAGVLQALKGKKPAFQAAAYQTIATSSNIDSITSKYPLEITKYASKVASI